MNTKNTISKSVPSTSQFRQIYSELEIAIKLAEDNAGIFYTLFANLQKVAITSDMLDKYGITDKPQNRILYRTEDGKWEATITKGCLMLRYLAGESPEVVFSMPWDGKDTNSRMILTIQCRALCLLSPSNRDEAVEAIKNGISAIVDNANGWLNERLMHLLGYDRPEDEDDEDNDPVAKDIRKMRRKMLREQRG